MLKNKWDSLQTTADYIKIIFNKNLSMSQFKIITS